MDSAIRIHSADHARAALRAATELGRPVTLISAAGAAGFAGAGYFAALMAEARRDFPDVAFTAILDCGDAPGDALGAMRQGVRHIHFSGTDSARAKLKQIAKAQGATLIIGDVAALDLERVADAESACRAWLTRTRDG